YYGDEIGMGDNVYLGDRNGVRTPMQWSRDRNTGFSSVEHGQLYLPVITDPVYGYEAVNVAAQARQPSSLLNTMRRLLAARRTSSVFGRGNIEFLRPRNSKVLAYLRRHAPETLLIGANRRAISGARLRDCGELGDSAWLALVDVTFAQGPDETYTVPLVLDDDTSRVPGSLTLALELDGTPSRAADAFDHPGFCLELL